MTKPNLSICYYCNREKKCNMHKNDTEYIVISFCERYVPDEATRVSLKKYAELQAELKQIERRSND